MSDAHKLTITVHTFTSDTDYGLNTITFGTEQEADAAAEAWLLDDHCDIEKVAQDNGADVDNEADALEWWEENKAELELCWVDLYEEKYDDWNTVTT